MSRKLVLIPLLVLVVAAAATVQLFTGAAESRPDPLLVSGEQRYDAYVRTERESMRAMVAVGDDQAARIHRERLRPASVAAGLSSDTPEPLKAARAAARVLSLDGRGAGSVALLDVESHAAGSGAAFDAIRDALWASDKGLVGSIDERLAGLRTELDRHRRGSGFAPASSLEVDDRRRLAAALDALAWRLQLATDRLAREL